MEDELELIEASFPSAMKVEGDAWRLSFSSSVDCSLFYQGGFCGKIRQLPVVSLSGIAPPNYPDERIEEFEIEAHFLSPETIQALHERLEEIAKDSVSVFFEWLTFLDVELRDVVGERCDVPTEALAIELVAFDQKCEKDKFNQALHTCQLCFELKPGLRFTELACREENEEGVNHIFCSECLQRMSEVHIDTGSVHELKCPAPKCRVPFPEYILKELLDAERYNKWEDLISAKALDQMGEIVYCPNCAARKIETAVLADPEDHHSLCQRCSYSFCGNCFLPYHPASPCLSSDERIAELRKRAVGNDAGKRIAMINEMMNLSFLTQSKAFRTCPSCKMKVEKNEGCNKIHCTNCGNSFCWKCEQVIEGYDHFSSGKCVLFEDETIRNYNAQFDRRVAERNQRQWRNDANMELNANGPPSMCPQCRSLNVRDRNNNIRCWNCQTPFCFICKKGYVSFRKHFKPQGDCPQHGNV